MNEFLEWCGLRLLPASDGEKHWFDADGDIPPTDSLDQPIIDLNFLFKYAVPLALEEIAGLGYCPPLMKLFQLWYDSLVSLAGDSNTVEYAGQALRQAIERLIEGGGK